MIIKTMVTYIQQITSLNLLPTVVTKCETDMRGSKSGLVTQLIEVINPYLDLYLDPVNTVSALVHI